MARKDRIVVRRTDSLAEIDQELDLALDRLAGVNEKVGEVLASMGITPEPGGGSSSETAPPAIESAAGARPGEEE